MTQPTERRFVMEPRLDAEIQTINDALDTKITHGTVVNSDVASGAAIDKTKIAGTAVTQADTGTVTGTMIADNTITSVDLATLDYIKFNTAYAGGSTQPGMLNWNDADGTLEFQLKGGNVTLQVGQEQVVRVKNETGAALSNGKAVYISGSNGVNLLASYANAGSESTSAQTIGITTETIGIGGHGFVTTFGLVRDIDTNNLIEGAAVWLDTTNGGLTATRPSAPNHSALLGFCLRKHATVGVIFVRVDNGWELDELHNVSITSPTNGQGLTYDAATQMWKNATPISALSGLSDVTITSPVSGEKLVYNGTKWVNLASAGSAFTVSDTAPSLTTASEGDAWVNSSNGTMAVCYVDPDGTKLWLQVQANSALEASILARLGQLESSAIALGTYSPNYLINGAFEINQRGFSSTTTGGTYGFDRWRGDHSAGATWSAQTFTPGAAPVAGYEAKNFLRVATSGQSATSTYTILHQAIEDVRTLAGQTVTVSFWAKAASGTPKVMIEAEQSFGSGGTPSSGVTTNFGSVTLSTSWTRYTVTGIVPSIAGKTIGTDANSSCLYLGLWVSAGSDFNARTGSLGIQSNTFDFWGVQVEKGSTATAFRRNAPSIQAELAACQRYYYQTSLQYGNVTTTLGNGYMAHMIHPVNMRSSPTITTYPGSDYVGTANRIALYNSSGTLNSTATFTMETNNKNSYSFSLAGITTATLATWSATFSAEL